MKHIRPPFIFPLLFRDVVFRMPATSKTLYLTFDDGPAPGVTREALHLLRNHGAKATFFVCGKQVENHPELLQQIYDDGHTVGNHSYSHPDGWKTPTDRYLADVQRAHTLAPGKLFRPPYGRLKLRQYFHLRKHYRIVAWDVMCGDYNQHFSPQVCFGNIRRHAVPGSVIVFHDSAKAATNMLYALEQTLIVFSREGYEFKTMKELL